MPKEIYRFQNLLRGLREFTSMEELRAFYNEIDQFCCAWLSNLMDAGLIMPGKISDKSITELQPDEFDGFVRVHFFAGIGGWDYALNLANWGARPVITGSCPCQPLSSAGQRKGHADERHLWPAFYCLIAECRPATVFGEQVSSKDGREWLSGVRADLEGLGYAVGAADLCAASVGAPHIRQRLFWVGHSLGSRLEERASKPRDDGPQCSALERAGSTIGRVADAAEPRRDDARQYDGRSSLFPARFVECGATGGLGNTEVGRERTLGRQSAASIRSAQPDRGSGLPSGLGDPHSRGQPGFADDGLHIGTDGNAKPVRDTDGSCIVGELGDTKGEQMGGAGQSRENGFWADAVWLPCLDGKARRIKSGSFPLAYGAFARMGRLRAYGNTIVPQVAAEFVAAFMDLNLR
jgi:DNA (cytosine-5)-methyltransferase 1